MVNIIETDWKGGCQGLGKGQGAVVQWVWNFSFAR